MMPRLRDLFLLLFFTSGGLAGCTSSPPAPPAVRIRWAADPQTLDPLLASTPQALEIINLLHCSLLFANAETRQYVPWLAETLPQIRHRGDSLTLYTYQLRPEATWDNGRPVLARDVAFTLKVLNCPGLPTEYARTQYGFVTDVELDTRDPRRFTLVCRGTAPDLLAATGDYAVLPEYALDPQGQLRAVPLPLLQTDTAAAVQRYPVLRAFARRYRRAHLNRYPERLPGCGPYSFAAWESGRLLRLRRKPRWWADTLPAPPTWLQARAPRLDYRIIPDDATALLALRRGDVDLYPMPPAREFNRLRRSADTVQLAFYAADSYEMTMIGFNTQRPALRDAPTRQALSLLFDVPGLMQATQAGLAYRSVSLITPRDTLAYNRELRLLPFDPAAAARQLARAGWQRQPDGTWQRPDAGQLALRISYRAGEFEHEAVALQFRAAAGQVGIPVRLLPTEAGLLQQQLVAGEIELYVRTLRGNPFSYNFTPILHSRAVGISNFTRYQSATADRLMDSINVASGLRRQQLVQRLQRQLRADAPLTVLYFTRYRLLARKALRGVRALRVRPGYDVLRLEPAPPRS